jgi:predicted ester cyclase
MTPEEMDEVLDRHFAGEAAHDLDAVLATLHEDCEHDVVGLGVIRGRANVAPLYQGMFDETSDESFTPIRRQYGDDFLVDEVMMTQRMNGDMFGVPGNGTLVTWRLLHICEFRDGLMSRENVWMDTGAIIAQLTAAQNSTSTDNNQTVAAAQGDGSQR